MPAENNLIHLLIKPNLTKPLKNIITDSTPTDDDYYRYTYFALNGAAPCIALS